MAKKKKPQLKPSVNRGFATTSVPKREEPTQDTARADKGGAPPAPGAAEKPAEQEAPAPPAAPVAQEAYDPERAELHYLVDTLYPQAERESGKRARTVEQNQRLARTLHTYQIDPLICEDILHLAAGRSADSLPSAMRVPEPVKLDGMLPTDTPLYHALASTAPPESDEQRLVRALTLKLLLEQTGFSDAHAALALEFAPSLELEACIAWLLLAVPPEELRTLPLRVSPSAIVAPEPVEATERDASDESWPPEHSAYSHSRRPLHAVVREERASGAQADAAPETPLDAVSPEAIDSLRASGERLLGSLDALLDSDSPLVDAIEHPVDAWCTARIIAVQLEQEKGKRRKVLGAQPEAALAEAAAEAEFAARCRRLSERGESLQQQCEMQPQFFRQAAAMRFRDRMQAHREDEARRAAEAQRDAQEKARRRAEVEAAARGDAAEPQEQVEQPAEPSVEAQPDGAEAPEKADADSEAKDAAADEDGGNDSDTDGDALAGMLDESLATTDDSGATVHVREIGKVTGRAPRLILTDVLKQVDPHGTVRIRAVGQGSVKRAQLDLRWVPPSVRGAQPVRVQDTFTLTGEGCRTQPLADELIATVALNCVGCGRPVHRTLAAGFRTFWDELEDRRRDQHHAHMCDELQQVQAALARRQERLAERGAPPQRATGTQAEDPAAADDAPRSGPEPDPATLQTRYAALRDAPSYQNMLPGREALPIAQFRDEILRTVSQSQVTVLSGETGCGKSTQLPAYLLEDCLSRGEPCRIYVTEPRRISAISLAQRVSEELGEPRDALGHSQSLIGYAIRLESRVSRASRLVYATTGIVLRMLESSAFDEITHIVVDEVHERSIESDFLLIVLKTLMAQRPSLKVVLMSATLDAQRISEYFGGCPSLAVPGRTFPVEVRFLEDVVEMCEYTPTPGSPYERRTPPRGVTNAEPGDAEEEETPSSLASSAYSAETRKALAQTNEFVVNQELIVRLLERICLHEDLEPYSRAILIFMPGMGEIRTCVDMLLAHGVFGSSQFRIYPLHSTLASDEQGAVFAVPPKGVRKIVVATNIAETGITIPDITCVIDSGKQREMRYDEKRKISRLVECFVARSNAKQRRGRAGRVQSGICFHLFTRMRHDELFDAHPLPEMLRLSLQELALKLKVMRVRVGNSIEDALAQALDPPLAINVQRAVASLVEVEALTAEREITPLGRHLSSMPLDVHLAKFLLIACLFRCLDSALTIAAALNSKSPFVSGPGGRGESGKRHFASLESDFLAFAAMYRGWRRSVERQQGRTFCTNYMLNQDVLYQIEELRQQFFAYLIDARFVRVDAGVRRELAGSNRGRGRGPKLVAVPAALDEHGEDPIPVTLALVTALYPKLLSVDRGAREMRTITNNQPAAIHPSSVNFRMPLDNAQLATRFVLYSTIVMSKRLYAWDTAVVPELMVYMLCGESDFRHSASMLALDKNRLRVAAMDPRTLVALRVMRDQLSCMLQEYYRTPSTRWTPTQEAFLRTAFRLLRAGEDGRRPA